MSNWSINSDPLNDFLSTIFNAYSGRESQYFSKTKLYVEYIKWCKDTGIPEHKQKNSMKAFTLALQPFGFVPERKRERGESYETFGTNSFSIKQTVAVDLNYHTQIFF